MIDNYHNIVTDTELKSIVFNGLVSFTSVCEKYKLCYFLAFGTLLGAVRHQGFIPWDDDIDLLMPREDYEKIRKIAKDIETEDWELLSYIGEPQFLMPYMKYCNKKTVVMPPRFNSGFVYGLSIDIFPLDFFNGQSEQEIRAIIKKMYDKLVELERESYKTAVYKTGRLNGLKRIIKKAAFWLNYKKSKELFAEYRRLDLDLTQISANSNQYAAFMYNPYNTVWQRKEFFGENEQMKKLKFEKSEFIVPFDYDKVLKKHYGNYMELPPLNERVSKHSFIAYYK